jgi:response regulator RpfG family c-di-GMP phosphodiesterase/serine/threonine protein kinase
VRKIPELLRDLLTSSIVLAEDWERLPIQMQNEIVHCTEARQLLSALVQHNLLTEYQADRVESGKTFGLVLGNYRVLDRLNAGGMGVVFRGEHVDLRRHVAIKVLPQCFNGSPHAHKRFLTEMRIVAQLHHPNIVAAMDAGTVMGPDEESSALRYFVMELVPGQDLEEAVANNGPFQSTAACDVIYQIAAALAEAHKHGLVHRDIKPSNIRVTPEGQAKLLDFGLARHFSHRMTEPGTMMGTPDYIAPEQARDARSVDIRADIYGLGGTLYWCLTGQRPFPPRESIAEEIACRLLQPPPSARARRPEISAELDALVARMMDPNPSDRYPTPQAVMQSLIPFLAPNLPEHPLRKASSVSSSRPTVLKETPGGNTHHILIADDEASIRRFCRCLLEGEGFQCAEATTAAQALESFNAQTYDLALLDIHMPDMSGVELCQHLRENPPSPNLKIIMMSGGTTGDDMSRMLLVGADDFLTKPLSGVQLQSRVKAALRLKLAQDRSDLLNQHLLAVNLQLEQNVSARDSDLVHARNALVLGLAKLVECRDSETEAHLFRLSRFCRRLSEEVAGSPAFAGQIDANYIQLLECCVPLHDIGKVGLPDHILLKPGKLDDGERLIMQSHTIIGADTLMTVALRHGSALAFLQMAADIARHHHESYDGQGYPERLAGCDIPLAARLTTVADVYDALRSRRPYRPALSHAAACQVMMQINAAQFDPALLQAFQRCASDFEKIYRELAD